MATLAQFLKTGSLGPLVLGMDPVDVTELIGDPDEESRKRNPLTLKYGALQLTFWKHGPKSQLRDMALFFLPVYEHLPNVIDLEDFTPHGKPTERFFRNFLHEIRYLPVHLTEQESGRDLVFLSGVVVDFMDGFLNSIRITQKDKKETAEGLLSDVREPSRHQIVEMLEESERVLQANARRSALVIAWAALEASLRRAALRRGRHGQIGVQSTILIRELLSAGMLSPDECRLLEELRQLRTVSVHGLAPVDFSPHMITEMNMISRRMLAETGDRRRQRDVADIFPIDAIEVYSVIISARLCGSLWSFLIERGLRGNLEENVIGGDDPQHDIQINKTIPFREFNRLVNEWKESYINA
jgi:hypothetical protein